MDGIYIKNTPSFIKIITISGNNSDYGGGLALLTAVYADGRLLFLFRLDFRPAEGAQFWDLRSAED